MGWRQQLGTQRPSVLICSTIKYSIKTGIKIDLQILEHVSVPMLHMLMLG